MQKLKKVPYGLSDFKLIQTEHYYYIDKTIYIEQLEDSASYLMFLRPRRFGKSLFISMLHYYYDIHYKDSFDTIFKGTHILTSRTEMASSFMIMKFDFSAVDTRSVERSFENNLLSNINNFIDKYKLDVTKLKNPLDTLNSVLAYASSNNQSIYILIDEYDNFSNKLLLENKTNYHKVISDKTAMFKQFFTSIKAGTGMENSPVKRMFITGVTPMTSYDVTSGFNIGLNISLSPKLNNLVGINQEELDLILEYFNLNDLDNALFKEWYNNYKFSPNAKESIYNTDMLLYYIRHYIQHDEAPKELIDINVRSDYSKLRSIVYTDGKLNGNFNILNTLISGETISLDNLVQDFSALHLSKEKNFKSLLFYLGLTTIKDAKLDINFQIPNETVKRIDIDFLKDTLEMEDSFKLKTSILENHLKNFAINGDIQVFKYLADEIKKATSIRDYIYNEQTVKAMYLAFLSLSNYYVIKSESELNKGFVDIFLKPLNPYVVYLGIVELKYMKRCNKPSKKLVKKLIEEAKEQLNFYEKDKLVTLHVENNKILKKVVLVFNGWELLECLEV